MEMNMIVKVAAGPGFFTNAVRPGTMGARGAVRAKEILILGPSHGANTATMIESPSRGK